MRITIDNKTYYRPINLSFNLNKIHKKLSGMFLDVCAWAVMLVMFFMMARMAWRCF